MKREEIQEYAALDALDLLSDVERNAYRRALAADGDARHLDRDLKTVATGLGTSVEQVEPPASLKERVFAALPEQPQAPATEASEAEDTGHSRSRSNIVAFTKYVPWAVAAGLALTCGLLVQKNTQLRGEVATLEQQGAMDTLRIGVLASMLQGSPDARAVAVWNGERQEGILTVQGLPPVPEGKDYQLWVIDPTYDIPVDGGVFNTDDSGSLRYTFHPDRPVSTANLFAVSLERKGGVPKAEGPMVLISSR